MPKSHRESYPWQYEHKRVGERVKVVQQDRELAKGTITRVVNSRFEQIAFLDDNNDTGYLLSHCKKDTA